MSISLNQSCQVFTSCVCALGLERSVPLGLLLLFILHRSYSSARRGLALSQAASQAASLGLAASQTVTPGTHTYGSVALSLQKQRCEVDE